MRILLGLGMAAIVAASAAYAFSPRTTPPLAATRLPVDRMAFTTLARAGQAWVAGGELGAIVWSADDGKTWTEAVVEPRRHALVTEIVFVDARVGMAVGHEGQILRTEDGGRHWKELAFDKERGEPLMSIARLPSGRWLAVGAFGRALASDDDGRQWAKVTLPGVEDQHLNRIVAAADGQRWLILGERGLVLESHDAAASWSVVPAFYNGSLYGAAELPGGGWLAYGMRGNAFHAGADARQWTRSPVPAPISLLGHARGSDGTLWLVGQGGMVLRSADAGAGFAIARAGGRAALTAIGLTADGQWLLASDLAGLRRADPRATPGPGTARAASPAPATSGARP